MSLSKLFFIINGDKSHSLVLTVSSVQSRSELIPLEVFLHPPPKLDQIASIQGLSLPAKRNSVRMIASVYAGYE